MEGHMKLISDHQLKNAKYGNPMSRNKRKIILRLSKPSAFIIGQMNRS
jgi:hypothetical protein